MATTALRVTEVVVRLSMTISVAVKTRFICNGPGRRRHRPTKRGPTGSRTLFGSTEVPMRTPSRPTIALAMGGVFATIGLTGAAAASAAPAHPALARPAVAHHTARVLSLTVPGTGLRLSTSVDDEGNVNEVDEMENEPEVNDVNDDANDVNDDANAGDPESGAASGADDEAGQADDANDDANEADDANDDTNDDANQADDPTDDQNQGPDDNQEAGDDSGHDGGGDHSGHGGGDD